MILDAISYIAGVIWVLGAFGVVRYRRQQQKIRRQYDAGELEGGEALIYYYRIERKARYMNWLLLLGSGTFLITMLMK